MTQSIGVALIARNAETTIRPCIESFLEYVDQCVVVLAGESTDRTEEIIRSIGITEEAKQEQGDAFSVPYRGCEVHHFDWIDDFAAARNYAFSFLKTDFLLWVDSDDVVYQPENIRPLIENAKPEVGAIWLPYHYALDEFGNVTTLFERERLLRASYGWVWKGRLHETVSALNPCRLVRSNDVIIRHEHRAGGDRNERNFKLLEIMLKEDPDDKRVWLYMGHQNFAANNWMEAAQWYLKFGSDKGAIPIERYQALCYGSKAMRSMQDKQAIDVCLMAIELYPNYRDAYLELAQCYLTLNDFDKVIHWCGIADIEELITEPPAIIFVNPLDYTFNKYAMLSEAYLKKGDTKSSKEYMRSAYTIRPIPEIEAQIQSIEAFERRNRATDSIKILAVDLLNNREMTKLQMLLQSTPYWFRDTDDYKTFKSSVLHYTSEIKDEPQLIAQDDGILVNLGNSQNPIKLLSDIDKYDKVTLIAPTPMPDSKQIQAYSQSDIEDLIMSKEGRHLLNLHKEPSRIICEYDHKLPKDLAIRIFTGQGLEQWSPKTIEEIGCGGSETAAAYIAREFAQRDCQPIIYAMDNEIWDGVIYRPYTSFQPDKIPCHLFISSRVPEVFYDKIPAEQKWLWFHDIHRWDKFTPEIAQNIDALIVLSQWHANFTKATYPFLKDAEVIDMDNNILTYNDCEAPDTWYTDALVHSLPKIVIIGDGITTSRFKKITEKRIQHRFIWCSSPDRGLEQVLELWPLIKKEIPDAELKIFYGWEYFDNYLYIPSMREFKEKIRKLIRQDGVEWCGRVGQKQITKELMRADIMLYPPPHNFRETYGIAFLEAQAAGVLCFYRKNGALGETIGDRGVPLELDMTQEDIVQTIVDTFKNKEQCSIIRRRARKYALGRDWAVQAEKMLALYRRLEE